MIPNFDIPESVPEFHSVISITWGELEQGGFFNWDSEQWHWDYYNEEQRQRMQKKFSNRYYWREIGITPPLHWKTEFLRKLNEIMPKYKPLYEKLEKGSIFQAADQYGKSRDVFSDFPQTQLGDNQDYASNGTDKEYENVTEAGYMETAKAIKNGEYDDIDVMILDEMSTMFSSLLTVSMNG